MTEELHLRRLLIKNTGVQIVGQIVSLAVGLATTVILSRYLGVERFGQFNYILFGFYFYFLALNDFGVSVVVVRECSKARDRAGEIIGAMLTFKLILSAFSVLAAWLAIWWMNFPAEQRDALFLYALILPVIALQLPTTIFQVILKLEYSSLIGIATRLVTFLLLLGGVWIEGDLRTLVVALVIAEIFSACVLLAAARKFVTPVWRFDARLWKEVLRSSIPLGVMGLFVAVLNRSGFILLERMSNPEQLGLYSAAYRITNLLESFPIMVMATIYPLMARYAAEDVGKLRALYKQSVLLLTAVAIPMAIVITLLAPWIIQLLYGPKFAGAENVLRVLIWATMFLYIALSGGNLLIATGREQVSLTLNIIAAILSLVLGLLFIPKYGHVGAALTNAACYFFILVAIFTAVSFALRTPSPPASTP